MLCMYVCAYVCVWISYMQTSDTNISTQDGSSMLCMQCASSLINLTVSVGIVILAFILPLLWSLTY